MLEQREMQELAKRDVRPHRRNGDGDKQTVKFVEVYCQLGSERWKFLHWETEGACNPWTEFDVFMLT